MVMFFGAFQVQHYSEPCLCRYHRPSTCQTDLDSKHSKLTRAVHGYAILVSLQHRAFRNLPVHHHFPTIKSLFPVYPSFRHTHICFYETFLQQLPPHSTQPLPITSRPRISEDSNGKLCAGGLWTPKKQPWPWQAPHHAAAGVNLSGTGAVNVGWLRTGSLRYCETITFKNRKQRETYSNIHYHQSE